MAATVALNKTFYEEVGRRLRNTSQLKLFNILKDSDGDKFMNIFRSFSLNEDILADAATFDTYEVSNDDWWENISYEYYGTPFLWWVIALVNEVVNPFEELEEGDNIRILREQYLYVLFTDIENIADL